MTAWCAIVVDPPNLDARVNAATAARNDRQAATGCRLVREILALAPSFVLAVRSRTHGSRRPLVVGYLSPNLARHPVGYFLLPVLKHHDRSRVLTICYNTGRSLDAVSLRLRDMAAAWVESGALDDEALARRIIADGVDILVDLAGYTAGGRPKLLSLRPAPVLATWAGFPGTTGLAAVDYILADAVEIPPGAEAWYSERPIRLPQGYVCYQPPDYAPEPSPLPAKRRGFLTLGCFNNLAKVNDQVLGLWSRILQTVERSRLVLLWPTLLDPAVFEHTGRRLVAAGMPRDRFMLGGFREHVRLLAAYREMDIALDPFPYSGGVTTLEALWMGIPVVTLPGDTFASRHSASHLTAIGLQDWIVGSAEEYVNWTRGWARRLEQLDTLRASLRTRMATSMLCSGADFTRELECAYELMWRESRRAGFARRNSEGQGGPVETGLPLADPS
ncbi:MAG: hypothetical protein HYR63_24480 [Proteobacteria bacterium]|nr:hypothetical protein [Pseudomonadota bacterium]